MSAEEYAALLAKLQGNDVDAKIDAVGKLQVLLDTEGFELTNVDDLIAALKICLKTANQHLTTPTLLLFPSLFRHLASNAAHLQHEIRFAFTSFLPSGGVFDRLGDTRDRARDAAKAAIVSIARLAFEHGGPSHSSSLRGKEAHRGPESPMMLFEKGLRENGFGNKIARVREQSIQCLVMIREAHPGFPLRPYVARSVELLEDGDGSVRDTARASIISLFTAPGVTDAARADLKNEMSKRGVRKTIVDAVLSKLAESSAPRSASVVGSDSGIDNEALSRSGGSTSRKPSGVSITRTTSITSATGSTNGGENLQDTVPPTTSSSSVTIAIPPGPPEAGVKSAEAVGISATSTDIPTVFIASARDLENEMDKMLPFFQGKETEHNWADRERSTITIRGLIKGGVYARYPDVFLEGLKSGILDGILKALASLRTTLSSHACVLLSEMAEALQQGIDPFVDRILTALLKMAGFTKKIIAQQSQASVAAVIANTSAQPRVVLPLIWSYVQEKNVQSRSYMLEHLTAYLKTHAVRSKNAIESSGGIDIITKSLQKTLSDPNPGVRPLARTCFWTFEPVWPANALVIADQLDASTRKQLEKANPNPDACTPIAPAEEVKKKPSVAAAIAASRAKAKAIATAPPTLRHAVTSPPSRRAVSPPPAKTPLPQRQTSPRVPSTGSRPPSRPPSRSAGSPGTSAPSRSPIPPVPPLPRPSSRASSPTPPSPTSSSSAHRRQVSGASVALSSPGRPSTLRSSYSQIRPGARAAATNANGGTSKPVPATVPPVPRVRSPILSKSMSSVPQPPISPTRRATSPVTPTRRPGLAGGSPGSRKPLPSHPLPSLAQRLEDSESLLHAVTVPIPDDDDDESMNLIDFSTSFKKSSTTTPPRIVPSTIARDMREPEESLLAKAMQATSAASQLEDEIASAGKDDPSPYPAELLANSQTRTPINRRIMREAALFQNSPQATKTPTILDQLFERGDEKESWVHKRSVSLRQASVDLDLKSTPLSVELRNNIDALTQGTADESVLRRLAVICAENGHSSVPDVATNGQASPEFSPSSPTHTNGNSILRPLTSPSDIWLGGKTFDKLFDALTAFLTHDKSAELLDLGLAVVWEMLRHQWEYVTEHQAELWMFLIRLRYANSEPVLQGTNAIRDALTAAVEPIFGLTTANGCLLSFLDEGPPSPELEAVRANSWAYGLVGIAKIMMRLPADILEEEIPRIRSTLTTAICYEQSALVRGAATVAIAACQMVLRDETHLFALLGNLPNEKKNLLTYYFNRTGSRGPAGSNVEAGKVDEELRKIDRGTVLPPRTKPLSPLRPST